MALCVLMLFDPRAEAQTTRGKANVATTQADRSETWDSLVQLLQKDPVTPADIGFRDTDISDISASRVVALRYGKTHEPQAYCMVVYFFDRNIVKSIYLHAFESISAPSEEKFQQLYDLGVKAGPVIFESTSHGGSIIDYKMICPEKGLPPLLMQTYKDQQGHYVSLNIDFPPTRSHGQLDSAEEVKFVSALKKAQRRFPPSTTGNSTQRSYPKFGDLFIPLGADWRTVLKLAPDKAPITITERRPGAIEFPDGTKATWTIRWMTFEKGRLQRMDMQIVQEDIKTALGYLDKDRRDSGSRRLSQPNTLSVDLKWKKSNDEQLYITLSCQSTMPNK